MSTPALQISLSEAPTGDSHSGGRRDWFVARLNDRYELRADVHQFIVAEIVGGRPREWLFYRTTAALLAGLDRRGIRIAEPTRRALTQKGIA
jgi:hypothetical protein